MSKATTDCKVNVFLFKYTIALAFSGFRQLRRPAVEKNLSQEVDVATQKSWSWGLMSIHAIPEACCTTYTSPESRQHCQKIPKRQNEQPSSVYTRELGACAKDLGSTLNHYIWQPFFMTSQACTSPHEYSNKVNYGMHLNSRKTKLLRFLRSRTPSANSLIRKYFEQVWRNCKKWTLKCPLHRYRCCIG